MDASSNRRRKGAGNFFAERLTKALSVANARLRAALGSPRNVINRLGIITTCITVFGPPLAVAVLGAYHLQQRASEQAAIGARHLELQLTRADAADWLTPASISVLQATHANDAVVAGWITDVDGNTLMFQGRTAIWPEVRGSEKVVTPPFKGYFNVAISSREVFIGALHVLAIFMGVGLAVHYCFRRLPLAAIDNAEQLLAAKQQELLDQKSQLETQNLRFDTALNHMSQALCMFDAEQGLVVCNTRYSELYGLTAQQVKPGTTLRQILEHRLANGLLIGEPAEEYIRQRLAVAKRNVTSIDIRELGDGRTLLTNHQPMPNGGWVATIEDITEQRRLQAQVARLAHHDALTDLPNRAFLQERLDSLLQARRRDEQIAVFCLDVDRFKDVNDTLGHPMGDALLHAVAKRLRDCIGETEIVARLGADEFCIVQAAGVQPIAATGLADRILECLEASFDVGKHQINIGASIGISLAPDNGTRYDELFKNANLALHRAKSEGRGTYRFFEPEMDAKMQARSRLQMDLRRALGNGEFRLHYQPVMNLARNEICGLEALLRWRRADGSSISPAVFIPLAEETGLIVPIGEWVLRQACADAATWPEHVKVAVNLSAVQFKNRRLVETVVSALATSGLPAHRLELEITESVLLQSDEATLSTLHQLRMLGVRIAMDDFGTGYSSLSYLRSFPFDKIKIDRCFVSDLSKDADESLAILRAVASLGTSLGIATTAEGVETQEQMETVRAEGCTEVQGFFFSPPRPIEDIARLYLVQGTPADAAASPRVA